MGRSDLGINKVFRLSGQSLAITLSRRSTSMSVMGIFQQSPSPALADARIDVVEMLPRPRNFGAYAIEFRHDVTQIV